MNQDQLLEAVRELREKGFEVTKKNKGYIPTEDSQSVKEDLEYYKKILLERLDLLSLSITDLENMESFNIWKDGKYKGHELMAIHGAYLSIEAALDALRGGRVAELVRDAVFLGCDLPDGLAEHPYDIKRNSRTASGKGGSKSKRKPWAKALAKELCHLTDDEIYWALADDVERQIETGNERFDIIFKEDPETLTHDLIQAIPYDDTDTPKAPQKVRLSTFLKYYVRPARKQPKKV